MCTKDSYICSIHFVHGNGPTKEDPDPISAIVSKERVSSSIHALWHYLSFELIFQTVHKCHGSIENERHLGNERQTERKARELALNDQRLKLC